MMDEGAKAAIYDEIRPQAAALLEGCPSFLAGMASLAALLKQGLPYYFWVGFYLPRADGALVVGPYQGPLACQMLPAGRGVCGAAARERRSIVVPDVHAFPGHIECSGVSRSEIVVPVLRGDLLRAVLDVDSAEPDAFQEIDRISLEEIASLLSRVQ